MIVASLIDLDEKTIPDAVTVPGTLIGLLLAAWLPQSLLPVTQFDPLPLPPIPKLSYLRFIDSDGWPWHGAARWRWGSAAYGCGVSR